jgi:hypothetical protein
MSWTYEDAQRDIERLRQRNEEVRKQFADLQRQGFLFPHMEMPPPEPVLEEEPEEQCMNCGAVVYGFHGCEMYDTDTEEDEDGE